MLARYRKEYDGEFVLTKTIFRNGVKHQEREWIGNPIGNQHISGRAAVFGDDTDKTLFDYRIIQNHQGGLLGSKRLQTYGTAKIWKEMRLDFYVSTFKDNIDELKDTNYWQNSVVYTSTGNCLTWPGKFYTIPYYPTMDDHALAVYLPAFDGHEEVFLLGYNKDSMRHRAHSMWEVNRVFRTFRNVKFWLVGVKTNMPELWRLNKNVAHIGYRDFITYCDI